MPTILLNGSQVQKLQNTNKNRGTKGETVTEYCVSEIE